MPWSEVSHGRYERPIGEDELFVKLLANSSRSYNREHWAMNVVAQVSPVGSLTKDDLASVFRNAWKALRFDHPTIAAYIVDETTYVYDVPDGPALEEWASETFRVVEDKSADELIPDLRPGPYATMTYLPKTNEVLGHSQHWRTDGVGGFILLDDFLALAARASLADPSTLPWGQEAVRLAPSIEEAGNMPVTPSPYEKELSEKYIRTFGLTAGAIGIATRGSAETSPGGTRIARLHLSEEETYAVMRACKARHISITSAVHASVAAANYAFAAPEDKWKHYSSTIRYSFRPYLPKPYSSRKYAAAIFTTGWMVAVSADSSWDERARKYNEEYHKGLSPEYTAACRQYSLGRCEIVRNMLRGPSPTDVDISSMGVIEHLLPREKGTIERGFRVDRVSGGLEMANRQCVVHVWTFRDQLCLNLVYNEAFYDHADMEAFVEFVRDDLLQELIA